MKPLSKPRKFYFGALCSFVNKMINECNGVENGNWIDFDDPRPIRHWYFLYKPSEERIIISSMVLNKVQNKFNINEIDVAKVVFKLFPLPISQLYIADERDGVKLIPCENI